MVSFSFRCNNFGMKLIYEVFGMAVLTTIFNLGGPDAFGKALFMITFLSWEASYAHFNYAVTIGEIIVQMSYQKRNITRVLLRGCVILLA